MCHSSAGRLSASEKKPGWDFKKIFGQKPCTISAPQNGFIYTLATRHMLLSHSSQPRMDGSKNAAEGFYQSIKNDDSTLAELHLFFYFRTDKHGFEKQVKTESGGKKRVWQGSRFASTLSGPNPLSHGTLYDSSSLPSQAAGGAESTQGCLSIMCWPEGRPLTGPDVCTHRLWFHRKRQLHTTERKPPDRPPPLTFRSPPQKHRAGLRATPGQDTAHAQCGVPYCVRRKQLW